MSQPQEARNAHLASSKGKGRLPASSGAPSCSEGGNSFEAPPLVFDSIRQNPIHRGKDFEETRL
ncbi:hypothetical protein ACSS6W_004677 [Trichoderma asperelloides]